MYTVFRWSRKIRNIICNVTAYITNDMVFRANIYFESPTRLRITCWKFSMGKSMVLTLEMIPNSVPNWWSHGQYSRITSHTAFQWLCVGKSCVLFLGEHYRWILVTLLLDMEESISNPKGVDYIAPFWTWIHSISPAFSLEGFPFFVSFVVCLSMNSY